jgi:hypothetical protein
MREIIARVQHEIWAHWMNYLFMVSMRNEDGSYTIPASLVDRWKRQMYTPYEQLSAREQKSDLEQADKVMEVINAL